MIGFIGYIAFFINIFGRGMNEFMIGFMISGT